MAKRPTVTSISSGYASNTQLNANFEALRDAFDNTLSLDGSTPNAMAADLDLGTNDLLNVGSINGASATGLTANLDTVVGISADITTVAGISADVTQVAADTVAINAASANAAAAAASAGAASTSETNAAASEAAAAASYDSFDDRYLGAKASDPAVDNDGDPLITGALYFNTTSGEMRTWNGSAWVAAFVSLAGALLASNNLSDVDDAATSLANLGLSATATEINVLDGVTASTAELNTLDGITATVTELNYVDGVTSSIQTQLNAKAALASPALTGTPTAPTAAVGTDTTQIATTAFVQANHKVVQVQHVQYTSVVSGSTAMKVDNTIPQITEGSAFMELAITPTNASNLLRIDVVFNAGHSNNREVAYAIFQDSTANAIAAVAEVGTSGKTSVVTFSHQMVAGTTSATTLKVRAGPDSTIHVIYMNGDSSGTQLFGGVAASSITITEIAV